MYKCHICDTKDEGIVYLFPVKTSDVVYEDSDKALILSCLPRFSVYEKQQILNSALDRISEDGLAKRKNHQYLDVQVEKLFHEICREVPAFTREIVPMDLLNPIFINAKKNNARILKQDGAFILTGLSADGDEEQAKLEMLSPLRVRVCNKEQILEQLDKVGINEAALFPEMDHVSSYLKSKVDGILALQHSWIK